MEVEFSSSNFVDERSYILQMSNVGKKSLGSLLLLAFIWGNLMKLVIYRYFFRKEKIMGKPINVLIILDQVKKNCFLKNIS
jgi:hypothetical protein